MARKILTLPEVAERIRMPLATIRYLRATAGNAPVTFKLGGRVVAFEDDVEKWLADQYAATATTPPAA